MRTRVNHRRSHRQSALPRRARTCPFRSRSTLVMVTVEADAMWRPFLARRGIQRVYSLAYGTAGAGSAIWSTGPPAGSTSSAGRGHSGCRFRPVHPETGVGPLRLTPEQGQDRRSQSEDVQLPSRRSSRRIECTALQCTGLTPRLGGLKFRRQRDDIPNAMRPVLEAPPAPQAVE